MTFHVNNDALKVAMMRHYEEKLANDLRQMFVFNSDPEMAKVWQYYLEELDRREKKQDQQTDGVQIIVTIMGIGMIIYGIYRILAFTPT